MNLRKRTVIIDLTKKPEIKKKKKKPLRRSERNKAAKKGKTENLNTCSDDTKKEVPRPRSRRKRLGWSRKKKPRVVEEYPSALLFPPVIETGFNDIIEEMVHASPEDMLLAREADLIYQCRACSSFFREFANYLKHKQIYCTTLAHKNKRCRDDWNSMLNKLGFDFGSDESAASVSDLYDDNTKLEVTDSEMEYFDPNLSEAMVEEEDNKETIKLEIINNKLKRPEKRDKNIRNSKDATQPPDHKKLLVEPHCSEIQTSMIKIEPVSPEETDNNRFEELFFNASQIKTEPVAFDESSILDEKYNPNTFTQTESQVSNIKKSNQNVRKRVSNNRRSIPTAEEDNVCHFCTEQFSKASDLRYHKRSEHYRQVLTYKCFICYAHLLSIPKLEKHISKTHNMDGSGIEIETEVMDLNDPRLMTK